MNMVNNNYAAICENYIEPMNPYITRETNQEEWRYVTFSNHSSTISIPATQHV